MITSRPVLTIFSNSEPLSEEEKKQLAEQHRREWFERTLDKVVAIAASDKTHAEKLARKCADYDELRSSLEQELSNRRRPRGRPKKWTADTYELLLTHYAYYFDAEDRNSSLQRLSTLFDELDTKMIERHITKARKVVQPENLPDWARSILKPQRRKPHKK